MFNLGSLGCALTDHQWVGKSRMQSICSRCGAFGQLQRHQNVREKSRRMKQILLGQLGDNSLAEGKQTRWKVQALAARLKAGMHTEKHEL